MNATRYIITRPCLAEGSLSILKYLEPVFLPAATARGTEPQLAGSQLSFTDDKGGRYLLTLDLPGKRLTGLHELYRDHNLGVNDVLLIRPEGPQRFAFEAVVKPLARPLTPAVAAAQAAARPPEPPRKRVVVHATPHVREVRLERGSTGEQELRAGRQRQETPAAAPQAVPPSVGRAAAEQQAADQAAAVQRPERKLLETRHTRVQPDDQSAGQQPAGRQISAEVGGTQASAARPTAVPPSEATRSAQDSAARSGPARSGPGQNSAVQNSAAQLQPRTPPAARPAAVQAAADAAARPAARDLSAGPASARAASAQAPVPAVRAHATTVQPTSMRPTSVQPITTQPAPAQPAPMQPVTSSAPQTAVAGPVSPVTDPAAEPTPEHSAAEEQLAELARLTGYRCEFLGGGVVRLRAEVGQHGYSVLLATGEEALRSPAWSESCDYMALLTPERVRPQGVPRLTHEALEALLDHARLAPLSPIDLRGYWNTGSFDSQSAASVAELVAAHLAQRGSFSYVLLTLAQQPAHSVVTLPRLAERLGSGVNTSELDSILDTLTRPPFLALSPLPGGQYYLRTDMKALLADLGEYAEGMGRRLSGTPLSS